MLKKLLRYIFDKDIWLSAMIDTACTAIFIFGGGYVAFMTSIQPWWYKLIFLSFLAIALYILCGIIKRAVFKKLGRKLP